MLKTEVIHGGSLTDSSGLCLRDSFLYALHSAQTTKPFFQLGRSKLPTFQYRIRVHKGHPDPALPGADKRPALTHRGGAPTTRTRDAASRRPAGECGQERERGEGGGDARPQHQRVEQGGKRRHSEKRRRRAAANVEGLLRGRKRAGEDGRARPRPAGSWGAANRNRGRSRTGRDGIERKAPGFCRCVVIILEPQQQWKDSRRLHPIPPVPGFVPPLRDAGWESAKKKMSAASVATLSPLEDQLALVPQCLFGAQPLDSILIFLAVPGKPLLPMRVLDSESVTSVKLRIQWFRGFVVTKQRLVFGGHELTRNSSRVRDYGLADGNVLHLVVRLADLRAITIKTANGKKFKFQVESGRNVGYLKNKIAAETGKEIESLKDLRLVLGDEELEDHQLSLILRRRMM
ncbi:phosphatidylinositol 4-kinase gamma 4-like [Panicum miliaceum]|uniref:Phosphatidylinositol 4-kinase gamma 4-like n=1 Tax=Panicum miliaceum TaxID=4540 RepID=A0A3L6QJ91_PANMI|nr:phosphatidylinositol 4-kinase gamma 4-like [Panicum miliaceum]